MAGKKKSRKTRRAKPSAAKSRGEKPVDPPASTGKPGKSKREAGTEEASPAATVASSQSDRGASDPVGGEVEFDPGIISDIAIREASEIEGIVELTGGWRTKGVTVAESAGDGKQGDEHAPGYVLDLRVAVEYGVNCVALAESVRRRIANAVRQMTGRRAVAVNVHVTGIREKGREEPVGGLGEESGPLGEEHGIDF